MSRLLFLMIILLIISGLLRGAFLGVKKEQRIKLEKQKVEEALYRNWSITPPQEY